MAAQQVLVVLFDGVQSLDVTGPVEVFAGAEAARPGSYTIRIGSIGGGRVRTSSGLRLHPDVDLTGAGPADLLLVPGGDGTRASDPRLVDWLRTAAPARRAGRVGVHRARSCSPRPASSTAGGPPPTGGTPTTLARRFPRVTVDTEPIFVRDGDVWTSAGVTAGIDLALAVVEEDHGRDVALEIARHLVMFVRRPGGQRQFSAQLAAQVASRDPLREVQRHIAEHPSADLTVDALARLANLSPRQFSRAFAAEVGTPPGRYVDRVRLETARRHLEEGAFVEDAARACGYGTGEAMRRAFVRDPRRHPDRLQGALLMQMIFVVYEGMTALDADRPVRDPVPAARRPGHVRRGARPARSAPTPARWRSSPTGPSRTAAPRTWSSSPAAPTSARRLADTALHDWLRAVDPATTWTTSVCTGSLILAAAGLLRGRTATSHWLALDRLPALRRHPVAAARRAGRQVRHRRRRLGRHRPGAHPRRHHRRPGTSPRRSSSPSSTTRSPRSRPAPPPRRRRPLVSHLRANAHLVMST